MFEHAHRIVAQNLALCRSFDTLKVVLLANSPSSCFSGSMDEGTLCSHSCISFLVGKSRGINFMDILDGIYMIRILSSDYESDSSF